ncbi:hypothetical protein [Marinobacter flavimaris]|jgi:hypothetical protein|uniref:hypothetical protein n=1 Tax=Marinobacter flavimaris TaxID=262076 RepID=UPI000D416A49|nr:hypothetical protein C9993_02565 [Marinobacter sp. Z-F4-2]
MAESNTEAGQRIQEKFQFYILGLTFTLLGLAIQTASFGTSPAADIMELLGWALLLTSALTLASRLEWTPQIYHLFDVQQDIEQDQRDLHDAQSKGARQVTVRGTGESIDLDDVLKRLDSKLSITRAQIEKLDKGGELKYKIHRYGFIFGLAAILAARAWPPVSNLLGL